MDSMSLVSAFPQELIDAILAENAGDVLTLCSCALVCHAFLPASQAQIFSNICLKTSDEVDRLRFRANTQAMRSLPPRVNIQTMYRILVGAPYLRSYVRTLGVMFEDADEQYYPRLVSILPLFTAVTSFRYFGDGEWVALPRELRTAITKFCHRPDLTTLWLWSLGPSTEPADLFRLVGSPNLRSLQLDDIVLAAPEVPWRNHIRLIELDLNLHHGPTQDIVTNWLIEGGSLTELNHASLVCEMKTAPGLQRILDMSSNLESLTLEPATPIQNLSIGLSLASLKKLRELEAHVYALDPEDPPRLCPLLAELLKPCGKTLKYVRLQVHISFPIFDWAPLANILTVEDFPVLEHVQIWFYWHPWYKEPAHRILADARSGLHHLDERGILECNLELETL
ncbi:hypothetical protein C8R47DRAFT_1147889 [Mycena vitilis]|nr:hypothetical protein C8R47DRAFT_1147889 [Mycena vitilis]